MEIIIDRSNKQMLPGFDSQGFRDTTPQAKRFIETHMEDGKEKLRQYTNYEVDYLVSTEKTRERNLDPIIVSVDHYNMNKKRDGMVVLRELRKKNIRPSDWRPKVMVTVAKVPDNVYCSDEPERNGPGRPARKE